MLSLKFCPLSGSVHVLSLNDVILMFHETMMMMMRIDGDRHRAF